MIFHCFFSSTNEGMWCVIQRENPNRWALFEHCMSSANPAEDCYHISRPLFNRLGEVYSKSIIEREFKKVRNKR